MMLRGQDNDGIENFYSTVEIKVITSQSLFEIRPFLLPASSSQDPSILNYRYHLVDVV